MSQASQSADQPARILEGLLAGAPDAPVAELPSHVLIALEHLTPDEQRGVLAAIGAFARGTEATATRLAGPDPLYLLQAAPDVRVIVRMVPNAPAEVLEIVRPATLRLFSHAR